MSFSSLHCFKLFYRRDLIELASAKDEEEEQNQENKIAVTEARYNIKKSRKFE